MIHATAQIDAGAKLGANVSVGAYSVIGADVEIGDGTQIAPHVVIQGPAAIIASPRSHRSVAIRRTRSITASAAS